MTVEVIGVTVEVREVVIGVTEDLVAEVSWHTMFLMAESMLFET